MQRNIIAISGGGFSKNEGDYIDEYIIQQVKKDSPVHICFIPTASGDAQGYIEKFYQAFPNANTSHLTVNDLTDSNIQEIVHEQDILYVGGGNTQLMLEKWRQTRFDKVLKEAYANGVLLAGISAGAMCWFEICYSEKADDTYEEFEGLGILESSLCPHYNDEKRQSLFDKWATKQLDRTIFTLEDNENLHFKNEKCIAKIST